MYGAGCLGQSLAGKSVYIVYIKVGVPSAVPHRPFDGLTSIIPAFARWRQKYQNFKVILSNIAVQSQLRYMRLGVWVGK